MHVLQKYNTCILFSSVPVIKASAQLTWAVTHPKKTILQLIQSRV